MKRLTGLVPLATLLVAVSCGPGAMAAELSVDARHEGEAVVIVASAVIDADARLAWRTLTDYARYAEFVPGLRTSKVLRRNGMTVTVEQTGTAELGFLQFPIAVLYDITESPPDALRSRGVIEGVGTLESGYVIEPWGRRVRLRYVGRLTTHSLVLRPLEQAAGRQTITRQFQALIDEIERVAALGRSSARGRPPLDRAGAIPCQSRQKPETPGSAEWSAGGSGASLT